MVFRFGPTSSGAQVGYTTRDGSARAGTDYIAQRGTIDFQPLQTITIVSVEMPTRQLDSQKSYWLVLTNPPTGASLGLYSELEIRLIPSELARWRPPSIQIINIPSENQPSLRLLVTDAIWNNRYAIQMSRQVDFQSGSEFVAEKVAFGEYS